MGGAPLAAARLDRAQPPFDHAYVTTTGSRAAAAASIGLPWASRSAASCWARCGLVSPGQSRGCRRASTSAG